MASHSIGKDKTGREIFEGDEVLHDNHIRPPGTFRVRWDDGKIGYVLVGTGEHSDFWLQEWCTGNVTVINPLKNTENEV